MFDVASFPLFNGRYSVRHIQRNRRWSQGKFYCWRRVIGSKRKLLDWCKSSRKHCQTNSVQIILQGSVFDNAFKVELPGFCKMLPQPWFNKRESRFDEACLEHKLQEGTPSTVPHPFMKCSNPLEVIAAIAICVSMVSNPIESMAGKLYRWTI